MKLPSFFASSALAAVLVAASAVAHAQRLMENLSRGVVAIHQPDGKVAVSWRLLGIDPEGVAFNLYRQSEPGTGGRGGGGRGGGAPGGPAKLNTQPLTGATFFVDENANLGTRTSYFVRAVVNGVEQEPSTAFALP